MRAVVGSRRSIFDDVNDSGYNSEEAVERLTREFLKHQHLLLAYVRALVRDYHQAEDIVQETAVVLIRRAADYEHVDSFWALAREVARRQSLAMRQKEAGAPRPISDAVAEVIGAGFDRVQESDAWDREALLHCLGRLPDRWRRIVRLRYWMRYSVKRIAEELGRSANTVSVTLSRARIRLADCVGRRQRQGGIL